jgi:hypothetical protein
MRDLLPRKVYEALQDRYAAGVSNAEALFDQHAADEDSVTGGLGQALAAREPMYFSGPGGQYRVNVSYRKLRGRGDGAPERFLGADGIFQIEVLGGSGDRIRTKGLPFQAKKGWKGKDQALLNQAKKNGSFRSGWGGNRLLQRRISSVYRTSRHCGGRQSTSG